MMIDMEKLNEWYRLSEQLNEIKTRELELRNELFAAAFPTPVEGSASNKLPLAQGWILQGDHKINRTVDEAAVSVLRKGDNTGPLIDKLFNFKPSLVLKEWKALGADDLRLVADTVTEKPGTPSLKIVLPKR